MALKVFSDEKLSATYLDTKWSIISYFNLPLVTKIDDDKGGGSFSDENKGTSWMVKEMVSII